MDRLPREVVVNILSRLPVKCLLRFRCLSKPFCSIIDSQDLIKIHLKHSIETNSNLSLLSDTHSPIYFSSRFWTARIISVSLESLHTVELDHPFIGEVIDSCNGLIALRDRENDWRKVVENGLALWNPSTKKHLIIPNICIDFKDCYCCVDGFGYDAASDDYKVVRIIQFRRERIEFTELAVYSLKTNSWKRSRVDFPYHFRRALDGTFADGHVYWSAAKNPKAYDEDVIVALELKIEELHEVQPPTMEDKHLANYMSVGTFKGGLYCSCFSNDPTEPIDMWLMKESWTKLFSFPRRGFGGGHLKAWAYSKNGEDVLVDAFVYEGEDENTNTWKLFWFDIQNQRTTARFTIRGVPNGCRPTIVCVDGLVSPTAYTGRGV